MPSDWEEVLAGSGAAGVVRERGRARVLIGRAVDGSSGVDAVTGDEIEDVVELVAVVLGIVWYVRTGRRSTTDFGARHLRRRIRDRRSRSAYTTVSVTSGETTSTRSVSKKGDDDIDVGVRVTQSPS